MNFVIRFSLRSFIDDLAIGSTVYSIAYTVAGSDGNAESSVLLTSNAGIESGPIQVLRLIIEGNRTERLSEASQADDKIIRSLKLRGMKWRQGVLLTAGLQDALRFYSAAGSFTVDQVEEMLSSDKQREATKGKKTETVTAKDKR